MAWRDAQPSSDQPASITARGFKGINNRIDPTRLGPEWQIQADNALCDDAGHLLLRPGQRGILNGITDIYGARDGRLFAISEAGELLEIGEGGNVAVLAHGVLGAFRWAELGYALFLQPSSLSSQAAPNLWAIYPNRVVGWGVPLCPAPEASGSGDFSYRLACAFKAADGRIGGTCAIASASGTSVGGVTVIPPPIPDGHQAMIYASLPDGAELLHFATVTDRAPVRIEGLFRGAPLDTLHHYPPPIGDAHARAHNRMVIGVWEPALDRSILYYSRVDNPHLFRLDEDFQMVPGRVALLESANNSLIIGTDRAIYVDSPGSPLQRVADYGTSPGASAFDERGVVYFWSSRGLCRAIPFENLTDDHFLAAAHERGTAGILPFQGSAYAIVSQQGAKIGVSQAAPYQPMTIFEVHHHGMANQYP